MIYHNRQTRRFLAFFHADPVLTAPKSRTDNRVLLSWQYVTVAVGFTGKFECCVQMCIRDPQNQLCTAA